MQIGLIGTGYAAKLRAETLQGEAMAELVAVAGRSPQRTEEFCQPYGAIACAHWQELVAMPNLDLIIISTINQDHGAIAHAVLQAGRHAIVEYPLSLDVVEAESLIALARAKQRLLHVEHIELLGGVHTALRASLPSLGEIFYARYVTLKPERPAPQRWSYHSAQFGFPLVGALSRLHRLVDLFGEVESVSCNARFWAAESEEGEVKSKEIPASLDGYYTTCLCTAHLRFKTGVLAEVTYGKGEALWQSDRTFEVHGERGALVFAGEQGTSITADGTQPIEVGSRRGLFAKDTGMVLDHLTTGTPLYVTPEASLYTLQIADAARRSAETGRAIVI